jgi:anti-sigma factor RsiW
MATDRNTDDSIARLNALIDGELPPADHAALADRIAAGRDLAQAHATLARLKACIVETAAKTPVGDIAIPHSPRRRRLLPAIGLATAAAAALLALAVFYPAQRADQASRTEIAPLVTLAALPVAPVIPDLTIAGLNLVGGEVETSGQTAVLVAAYRGPRGCRLELRVRPAGTAMTATVGTTRAAWTAGDLAYELVAFGMPAGRFAAVAAAAEASSRAGAMPENTTRLREASLSAPPCTG